MVVSRAVSTVLDASLAVLLVSAAAVVLVTLPGGDQRPPDPDAAAQTVLASTTTAEYHANGSERAVSGRVDTLLAHAAVADDRSTHSRFASAVEAAVADVLAATDGRVSVVATAGSGRVRAGPRPPPSASVAAVTHRAVAENDAVTITVRTWSP